MNKIGLPTFLLVGVFALLSAGCTTPQVGDQSISQKLESIIIPSKQLSGSPKELVHQLNKLSKKHDLPQHIGVKIIFDPAVDAECCSSGMVYRGKPLSTWLASICESCGATYRVDGSRVIIELLPLSDKQTPDLEQQLPKGLAELCREFRAEKGKHRVALGHELFRLLPHSPQTVMREAPLSTWVSYDYQKPSYKLFKRDILKLLGPPDRNVNNQHFYYFLGSPPNKDSELGVDFWGYDYVTNPSLHWNGK